ncbi:MULTISPECIES: hypothetical protein [unclassified Polaromonas]|uniref:hypothetical protein n=1 Tax=unclassified Polaromonas TaxID=2638319 RepID=UPI000F07ECA0|nr:MULTISPECIES: hypothetical protein [unclassified Polaromonas]AYQ28739.1 hypothetical protein DT070_12310 [Polaromonas sp. SP1]QGJ20144.1 hypothetical protein F7R28_18285 [Polaromonas sp. Pch-P]
MRVATFPGDSTDDKFKIFELRLPGLKSWFNRTIRGSWPGTDYNFSALGRNALFCGLALQALFASAQEPVDARAAAARAFSESVRADAKALHERNVLERNERHRLDPTWAKRMELAKKIEMHQDVHKAYLRHFGVAIWKCHEVPRSPEYWGSEKYLQNKATLAAQIDGGAPLGNLAAPGTKAFEESVMERADWLATWHEQETLELASRMLDQPAARPIVVSWASSYFNLNLSCSGKHYDWETTPEDRMYLDIRKQLNF